MELTRRHVLAAMAAVPVVGTLSTGAVAWSWWDRAPGEGLKALSADEYQIVQAFAEAWMPPGGDPELSGADANLGAFFDDLVVGMGKEGGTELKMLLHVVDNLARPTQVRAFRNLPLETRTQLIRTWMDSPIELVRLAITAVIVLLAMGWTTHPDVVGFFKPMFRCGYGR